MPVSAAFRRSRGKASLPPLELSVGGRRRLGGLESRTGTKRCAPSPLRSYPSEGQKRRGGLESEMETRWPCGVYQEALGPSGRVPSFETGTLRHLSGMFRRGGKKDAGNKRRKEGGLLESTETIGSRIVQAAFVCVEGARASGRVPPFNGGTLRRPLRNYPLGGAKETR